MVKMKENRRTSPGLRFLNFEDGRAGRTKDFPFNKTRITALAKTNTVRYFMDPAPAADIRQNTDKRYAEPVIKSEAAPSF